MHLLALAPLLGLALAAVHGVPQQPIRLSPAVDGVPTPVRPAATCTFTPTILQTLSEDYPATKFPNAVNDPEQLQLHLAQLHARRPGQPHHPVPGLHRHQGLVGLRALERLPVVPGHRGLAALRPGHRRVPRPDHNQPQDIVAGKWTWYDRAYPEEQRQRRDPALRPRARRPPERRPARLLLLPTLPSPSSSRSPRSGTKTPCKVQAAEGDQRLLHDRRLLSAVRA